MRGGRGALFWVLRPPAPVGEVGRDAETGRQLYSAAAATGRFRPVRDEIRLLGRAGGYTDNPARAVDPRQEPEAVDRATQERITMDAVRSWPHLTALHEGDRASEPFDRRIARCKAQAKHVGVDIHQPLRLARLAISNGRSHAHVERRIEALETLLWPR